MCYLNKPIYHLKEDHSLCKRPPKSRSCEIIHSPCYNKWIELQKINTYFYYCCDERCQLKLLCEDQVTVVHLTAGGLFNVDQGCVIKSDDFWVYSHKQQSSRLSISSRIQAPEISPINRIINISLPQLPSPNVETDNMTHEYNLQLQEIKQQIDIMKRSEPIAETVSYHDVHHYAAIYVLFLFVAGGAVTLAWWRCRRAPLATAEAARAAAPQPTPRPSASVQCSEYNMGNQCSVTELSELPNSARVSKQNKSTSPVLRSVFSIPDSSD